MFSKTPGEESVRHNSVPAPCYQPGGSDGLVDGMKVPCKSGNVDVPQKLEELSVTKGERGSLRPIVIDGSNVAFVMVKTKSSQYEASKSWWMISSLEAMRRRRLWCFFLKSETTFIQSCV